ncbi:hypothetical protein LEP1GSC194_0335 [Leptospira alstonii serovar Sichuan str. 79601]|uniref:Uncharacterized protein n=1 Tax=Leptospira alstonii serovar Sichuan str. 79601 TaxID=1218565 RepID=M6CWW0_9LEPT|nr:hypothetical protein LEP1GSC194_0335 [Leptospira alstonii serovar Sichuan str. 79601]
MKSNLCLSILGTPFFGEKFSEFFRFGEKRILFEHKNFLILSSRRGRFAELVF